MAYLIQGIRTFMTRSLTDLVICVSSWSWDLKKFVGLFGLSTKFNRKEQKQFWNPFWLCDMEKFERERECRKLRPEKLLLSLPEKISVGGREMILRFWWISERGERERERIGQGIYI